MWQKCPICNGFGKGYDILSKLNSDICSTCNGTKIISELSGLPPNYVQKVENTSNKTINTVNSPYPNFICSKMRIYQLRTAEEFLDSIKGNFTTQELMQMYAEDVAKRFSAECVNETLGNNMEVSNALHSSIEKKYKSIVWGSED